MAARLAILCEDCKVVHLLSASDSAPEYCYNAEKDDCIATPKDDLQDFLLKHQRHHTTEVPIE